MADGWTLDQMQLQTGKRIFLTGANSGVGYSAAVELARRGAVVVLACRDRERGQAALTRLKADALGPDSAADRAELVELDLASLASVHRAAEHELARNLPLDVLVNNAGVMAPPKRQETQDGFELQFGTNVLGHFALTCLMMPALRRAHSAARVVTLASIAHKRGKLHFDDLQSTRSYSPMGAYQQSKLADLMFAFELERRFRTGKDGLLSIPVHPGVAESNLFQSAPPFFPALVRSLLNSQLDGAIPTLFAATSPNAKGGVYYGSQQFFEMRGGDVGEAKVAPQARDETAQRKLWQVCEELTGVTL